MADDDVVLRAFDRGVLTLTLNRPDRFNAWNRKMEARYFDLLDEADADPRVRAIVVTGAGAGFCPGMDTKSLEAATRSGPSAPDPRPMTHALGVRKLLVAAINGACAGIGLIQAMACDVRFAAAGAKLSTAFTRRGLPAEYSSSWLLLRLVGHGRASDLLLSGRKFDAEEARALGIVNFVVPDGTVLDAARAYAADVADNCAPGAVAAVKEQLAADWARLEPASRAHAAELAAQRMAHPDFAEGVTSYVERRPPRFAPLPAPGSA